MKGPEIIKVNEKTCKGFNDPLPKNIVKAADSLDKFWNRHIVYVKDFENVHAASKELAQKVQRNGLISILLRETFEELNIPEKKWKETLLQVASDLEKIKKVIYNFVDFTGKEMLENESKFSDIFLKLHKNRAFGDGVFFGPSALLRSWEARIIVVIKKDFLKKYKTEPNYVLNWIPPKAIEHILLWTGNINHRKFLVYIYHNYYR